VAAIAGRPQHKNDVGRLDWRTSHRSIFFGVLWKTKSAHFAKLLNCTKAKTASPVAVVASILLRSFAANAKKPFLKVRVVDSLKPGDRITYTVPKKARSSKYECTFEGVVINVNKRVRIRAKNKAGVEVLKDVSLENLKKVPDEL